MKPPWTERRANSLERIKPRKTRVQLTTCKSATYSFYTKASKKSERNLKNSLKRLDLSNLI